MSFTGSRRFVGIGFGPIQAGLFLLEAHESGAYAPPTVVDIREDLVAELRANGGQFTVNIAGLHGRTAAQAGPVEPLNSQVEGDRERIIAALVRADEAATALPSVATYRSGGAASPAQLLASALQRRLPGQPLVVYCAENHVHAADVLRDAVLALVDPDMREQIETRVRFTDTVIGKMSGVVDDRGEMHALGLAPITPSSRAAFLVEAFRHIPVQRLQADPDGQPRTSGMGALVPVDDLEPLAAAKLFGHNATHALAAYLARLLGRRLMAELRDVPGALAFLRAAFLEESGAALRYRYAGTDPMFSPDGYRQFADDLLERMVNPYLADSVARAARDPLRKLGWDDRLIGLIRLGREAGLEMRRYAIGSAAALVSLEPSLLDDADGRIRPLLRPLWPNEADEAETEAVLALVEQGLHDLRVWRQGGFTDLVF